MFTGIIEKLAIVKSIEHEGTNIHFTFESELAGELRVDQSVAHDGVCLTVVAVTNKTHTVTAIKETLEKTNLQSWQVGRFVNIERCMPANGRFDGHIVQGHVDQTGTCIEKIDQKGSWLFRFSYDPNQGNLTVEKGSICINGTSLTCFESDAKGGIFAVAIIPYTFENTVFKQVELGDLVNLEFDIVGKYIQAMMKK